MTRGKGEELFLFVTGDAALLDDPGAVGRLFGTSSNRGYGHRGREQQDGKGCVDAVQAGSGCALSRQGSVSAVPCPIAASGALTCLNAGAMQPLPWIRGEGGAAGPVLPRSGGFTRNKC